MQTIDEVTKEVVDYYVCSRVFVELSEDRVIYGYTTKPTITILIYFKKHLMKTRTCLELVKDKLVFSKRSGLYLFNNNLPTDILLQETLILGQGSFPYNFAKNYEAIDNFYKFNGKERVVEKSDTKLSKYLKYTFGLEFETSQGYVPEDLCFRDGLIPLRDGSISGLEYSTIVLSGNKGINLLKQQVETLKEYTYFNKECSLHIHFGGFPLTPEYLYRLYFIYKRLEPELSCFVPDLTFNSGEYKANGKNYCKELPIFYNFNDLYRKLVGRPFFGDLTQPHPKDLTRERKWNINTRYYFLNFINAICYDVNKTIEFRFLRPTYNYNKILLWMYIFNGIMLFVEKHENLDDYYGRNLEDIITEVYPLEIATEIIKGFNLLRILVINQRNAGDTCGREVNFEEDLFKNLNL